MHKLKLIPLLLLLCTSTFPVWGQELTVEETLAYINKQLNDENNKFTYQESQLRLNLGTDWSTYKYDVKIENGNLKFLKNFFKNIYVDGKFETYLLAKQELSSSLKNLTSTLINHCSYNNFSYFYVLSNSSSPYENNSFERKTIKYNYYGKEEDKMTEKPNAIFFTIEFSNKNLICDKLYNAFTHLLELALKDPKYNTGEISVDNDPLQIR
ncbi:MAG: hypothetical protein IPQ06_11135 [Chitinophagaceae bacterium]|nr:hypothetical protein [Chitinophagaceae bacterium]